MTKIEELEKEIENLENKQFHKASDFRGNVKVMVKSNVKDYGILNYNLGFQKFQILAKVEKLTDRILESLVKDKSKLEKIKT